MYVGVQDVFEILRGKCLFSGIWLLAPKTNYEIINTDFNPNAGNRYLLKYLKKLCVTFSVHTIKLT